MTTLTRAYQCRAGGDSFCRACELASTTSAGGQSISMRLLALALSWYYPTASRCGFAERRMLEAEAEGCHEHTLTWTYPAGSMPTSVRQNRVWWSVVSLQLSGGRSQLRVEAYRVPGAACGVHGWPRTLALLCHPAEWQACSGGRRRQQVRMYARLPCLSATARLRGQAAKIR